jgi:PAS domain S-box-containing protein
MDLSPLQPLLHEMMETLAIQQHEILDKTGHWLSATVRPYRTVDNRIGGAVIVLADIDILKRNLRAAEEARDYAEGLIETVRQPLVVLDSDLRVQRATSAFYETFRVSRAETEGRLLYDLGNGQWNIPRLREALGEALFRNESFQDMELEHAFPHIGRRRMRLNGKRISPDGEQRRSVLLSIEDISERRQEAEIRYERLFETAKDGILVFDAETLRLTDVNPFFLELTGLSREHLIGRRLPEMEALGVAAQAIHIVEEAGANEIARHDAVSLLTGGRQTIQVDLVANRYLIGGQQVVQVNVRDVTARNRVEEQLRRQADLQEVLLKEIHHRVKNNLQIISSLLNLQAEYLTDKQAQAVLEEMNTRVRSIATIHEMLYSASDFAHIQFASYLNALAKDVSSFYSKRRGGIRFEIDSEQVLLDITQAVPCGLIVNELLTNGVKHAFPEGHPGVMKISFQCAGDECILEVTDNGIGLPSNLDPTNASSMGFQLLNLLVQQLKGTLEIDRSSGTGFTITFPAKGVSPGVN